MPAFDTQETQLLAHIRDAANACRLRGMTKREAVAELRARFKVPGKLRFAANRAFVLAYGFDGDAAGR